jgi:NAD(P)-dependent dehydrogenase (short-subunit alcohol dehydrogenase family)
MFLPWSLPSWIEPLAQILGFVMLLDVLRCRLAFPPFQSLLWLSMKLTELQGVNVDGTYLYAVAVAKHLMERKAPGSIVMIGSMSGAIVNVPQVCFCFLTQLVE